MLAPTISPEAGYSPVDVKVFIVPPANAPAGLAMRYRIEPSMFPTAWVAVPADGHLTVRRPAVLKVQALLLGADSAPLEATASPIVEARYTVTGMVAGGTTHTLFLGTDGSVYAAGQQTLGKLGNGKTASAKLLNADAALTALGTPVSSVTWIAANLNHSLLVKGGNIFAAGENAYGQLGVNTTTDSSYFSTPVAKLRPGMVPLTQTLGNVETVSAGSSWSLALDGDGAVWAWGAVATGRLGSTAAVAGLASTATAAKVAIPVRRSATDALAAVAGAAQLGNIQEIAAGQAFGLALDRTGVVWAWGDNSSGQLGLARSTPASRAGAWPVQYQGTAFSTVTAIAAGDDHAIALRGGSVFCWGLQTDGRLGNGLIVAKDVSIPTPVLANPTATAGTPLPLTGIIAIASGARHTLALDASGTVWSWGRNALNQLGRTTLTTDPTRHPARAGKVYLGRPVLAIAAGSDTSFALLDDGTIYAWGDATSGQLASGFATSSANSFYVCRKNTSPTASTPLVLNNELTDSDGDGLLNWQERELGTNPNLADTDADGISDGEEVNTLYSNPLNKDTDGDGMGDLAEKLNGFNLKDPADATRDDDRDGVNNLTELNNGTDPLDSMNGATPAVTSSIFPRNVSGIRNTSVNLGLVVTNSKTKALLADVAVQIVDKSGQGSFTDFLGNAIRGGPSITVRTNSFGVVPALYRLPNISGISGADSITISATVSWGVAGHGQGWHLMTSAPCELIATTFQKLVAPMFVQFDPAAAAFGGSAATAALRNPIVNTSGSRVFPLAVLVSMGLNPGPGQSVPPNTISRYTLDGSDPSETSTQWVLGAQSPAVYLGAGQYPLTARCFSNGYEPSDAIRIALDVKLPANGLISSLGGIALPQSLAGNAPTNRFEGPYPPPVGVFPPEHSNIPIYAAGSYNFDHNDLQITSKLKQLAANGDPAPIDFSPTLSHSVFAVATVAKGTAKDLPTRHFLTLASPAATNTVDLLGSTTKIWQLDFSASKRVDPTDSTKTIEPEKLAIGPEPTSVFPMPIPPAQNGNVGSTYSVSLIYEQGTTAPGYIGTARNYRNGYLEKAAPLNVPFGSAGCKLAIGGAGGTFDTYQTYGRFHLEGLGTNDTVGSYPFTLHAFLLYNRKVTETERKMIEKWCSEQFGTGYGVDEDGDTLPTWRETEIGTPPDIADIDHDGLNDFQEKFLYGTRFDFYDTDHDGFNDGFEALNSPLFNPLSNTSGGDTDGDGLSDFNEMIYGTNPYVPDSDGDGVSDGDEVNNNSNPNDPTDTPTVVPGSNPDGSEDTFIPPEGHVPAHFHFGDSSGSASEAWRGELREFDSDKSNDLGTVIWQPVAPGYGEVFDGDFGLMREGKTYIFTQYHLGTLPGHTPDFDMDLSIEVLPTPGATPPLAASDGQSSSGSTTTPPLLFDPNSDGTGGTLFAINKTYGTHGQPNTSDTASGKKTVILPPKSDVNALTPSGKEMEFGILVPRGTDGKLKTRIRLKTVKGSVGGDHQLVVTGAITVYTDEAGTTAVTTSDTFPAGASDRDFWVEPTPPAGSSPTAGKVSVTWSKNGSSFPDRDSVELFPVEIIINKTIPDDDDFVAVSAGSDPDLSTELSVQIIGISSGTYTATLAMKGTDGDIKFDPASTPLTASSPTLIKMYGNTPSTALASSTLQVTVKSGKSEGTAEKAVTVIEGMELEFDGTFNSPVDSRWEMWRPYNTRQVPPHTPSPPTFPARVAAPAAAAADIAFWTSQISFSDGDQPIQRRPWASKPLTKVRRVKAQKPKIDLPKDPLNGSEVWMISGIFEHGVVGLAVDPIGGKEKILHPTIRFKTSLAEFLEFDQKAGVADNPISLLAKDILGDPADPASPANKVNSIRASINTASISSLYLGYDLALWFKDSGLDPQSFYLSKANWINNNFQLNKLAGAKDSIATKAALGFQEKNPSKPVSISFIMNGYNIWELSGIIKDGKAFTGTLTP